MVRNKATVYNFKCLFCFNIVELLYIYIFYHDSLNKKRKLITVV